MLRLHAPYFKPVIERAAGGLKSGAIALRVAAGTRIGTLMLKDQRIYMLRTFRCSHIAVGR